MGHVDNPNNQEAYEAYKEALQQLSPKHWAYCRECIRTDNFIARQALPPKEAFGDMAIQAQLVAILA